MKSTIIGYCPKCGCAIIETTSRRYLFFGRTTVTTRCESGCALDFVKILSDPIEDQRTPFDKMGLPGFAAVFNGGLGEALAEREKAREGMKRPNIEHI